MVRVEQLGYDGAVSAINFHTKEISAKIVYYGPGLCGKTTSLQTIYNSLPAEKRPQLVSLATEVDRTIFFDFLPVTAYRIKDFLVRLQLYTVPGQVFYNATRKLVLNGVDGIVMVLDSQQAMHESNVESLKNLDENLAELGLEFSSVPMVLQYNKRDLNGIQSPEAMDLAYNAHQWPRFNTVATTGDGVFDALKSISRLVVNDLMRKGLGRELKSHENESAPPVQVDAAPAADGFAAVGDAVQHAATTASVAPARSPVFKQSLRSAPPPAAARATAPRAVTDGVSLWPPGSAARLGKKIDDARVAERWNDVLSAVDELILNEASRWRGVGANSGDRSPGAFLLVRGVSGSRYDSYLRARQHAAEGRNLTKTDAMNAVLIALQSVW